MLRAVRRPRLGAHRGEPVGTVHDQHHPDTTCSIRGRPNRGSRRRDRATAVTVRRVVLQETYAELGATDAAVDAALARLTAIWNDAQALDSDLDHAATPHERALAPDIPS